MGIADSHTAILAAAMQIPFVAGIPFRPGWSGKTAVVDGRLGEVIVEPDEDQLEKIHRRCQEEKREQERLEAYVQKEDVTLDGDRIPLLANIGELFELEAARHSRRRVSVCSAANFFIWSGRRTHLKKSSFRFTVRLYRRCRASRW